MKARLLFVDDDPGMCEWIADALAGTSWEVRWSTSGSEGFDMLKAHPFDVVVTDLNMPGWTGIEMCHRIVANWPDLPVVVLTAFGSMGRIEVDLAILAISSIWKKGIKGLSELNKTHCGLSNLFVICRSVPKNKFFIDENNFLFICSVFTQNSRFITRLNTFKLLMLI